LYRYTEDCHLLPQTLYTRACQDVFKLEEYDASVAPYLERVFGLPAGGALSASRALSSSKLGGALSSNSGNSGSNSAGTSGGGGGGGRGVLQVAAAAAEEEEGVESCSWRGCTS
jgi:hypothetical protein